MAERKLTSAGLLTSAIAACLLVAGAVAPATAGPLSGSTSEAAATSATSFSTHLTRAPYLTDLVGLHVAVNFATDQSADSATVSYGAVSNGSCTPATTIQASRRTILVGTVYEYQWTAELDLPAAGSYCYRPYLAGADLLGGAPTPRFTTQQQPGNTSPFSFDVMGDWGQVDSTGQNPDQANLMQQIAASGARFMVTVGDNGYPNGNQINYGDLQQTGADTSAIFGPQFWTAPGTIPMFTAPGNHGISGTAHTDITTWTEDRAVSTSGGRYQDDVYCCVNSSNSTHYASEWYAFTAGNARFYVLDASWGDTNPGTASPYANDAAAHWAPGTPEYDWLVSDLKSHPTQLKFAFFHYPLYVDNPNETSDQYLDGPANLEGLLANYGVQMVFNGHAHLYQRNVPSGKGMPISYVTGGGGGTLEPIGPCTAIDAYGIGWSPTKLTGTACGAAVPPTSAAQVYNFLKVTVSGSQVTVAPTNSLGQTFDVQTYKFKVNTDTWIDSGPPPATTSSSATFTFHGSGTNATYQCTLDGGAPTACTSPVTYNGLRQGTHTFTVAATVAKQTDPTPATDTWVVDTTAPTAPTGVSASAASAYEVDLSWSPSTDNTGVAGYTVYRDGVVLGTTGGDTTYVDDNVSPNTSYTYTVRAVDAAGNKSAQSLPASVTTPQPATPLFADGFESGDLSAWDSSSGLTVETSNVYDGTYAAEGNTTNGNTYAKKTLPATYPDAYAQVFFDIDSQSSQINLLRLRAADGTSLAYAFVSPSGQLGVYNYATGTTTTSNLVVSPGWHALQLRLAADQTPGTATGALQVWLDGNSVDDISSTSVDVGTAPVGALQIGEVQSGRTYDVVFDDAAFATGRMSSNADTQPPTAPSGLQATATSPYQVDLGWNASSDNTGVAGYTVYRDGSRVGSVGAGVTSYTDDTAAAASTYSYTVTASDGYGNESTPSAPASVTTPAGASAVFSDGFESGDLSAWDSSGGLTVESGTVHNGSYAAEGNTTNGATYAKKTLASSYSDGYGQVYFDLVSQSSQVNLLRLRAADGSSLCYVFVNSRGRLGVHNDATGTNVTSKVAPGPGWHSVQVRLAADQTPGTATGALQVWLDGALVSYLSSTAADVGGVPVGGLQIGEAQTNRTYDVVFDDAAFATARLGAQ